MIGLTTDKLTQRSQPHRTSESELRILHRAMDPGGGLILVPLRAVVIGWVIPEDEAGEQMAYLEVVRVVEEQTGAPFDPQLITDAEIHEAIVSEDNALVDDAGPDA
jgi:hypothetical protein